MKKKVCLSRIVGLCMAVVLLGATLAVGAETQKGVCPFFSTDKYEAKYMPSKQYCTCYFNGKEYVLQGSTQRSMYYCVQYCLNNAGHAIDEDLGNATAEDVARCSRLNQWDYDNN